MENKKKTLYHDRLRRYEDEKRKIIRDYPDCTEREYKEAVQKLAETKVTNYHNLMDILILPLLLKLSKQ